MNGFEKHGLTHTSVSQINTFSTSPSMWVAQKLFGFRSPSSPAMWRGIVTEDATVGVLAHGQAVEDATKAALEKFDENVFATDDKAAKERDAIPAMIDLAIEALADLGEPDVPMDEPQHQVKLTATGDGWKLPMIGYLDFWYPQHRLVVDLKTTLRMPSVQSLGHQRQRCFYELATAKWTDPSPAVRFLYVTPKKAEWREDGDAKTVIAEIKAILARQEAFLRLGDKEALRAAVPINPDDFFWNDCTDARRELFGV